MQLRPGAPVVFWECAACARSWPDTPNHSPHTGLVMSNCELDFMSVLSSQSFLFRLLPDYLQRSPSYAVHLSSNNQLALPFSYGAFHQTLILQQNNSLCRPNSWYSLESFHIPVRTHEAVQTAHSPTTPASISSASLRAPQTWAAESSERMRCVQR